MKDNVTGTTRGIGDGVDLAGEEIEIGSPRFWREMQSLVNSADFRDAYFGGENPRGVRTWEQVGLTATRPAANRAADRIAALGLRVLVNAVQFDKWGVYVQRPGAKHLYTESKMEQARAIVADVNRAAAGNPRREVGTFVHEGKSYSALGAVVTPTHATGYPHRDERGRLTMRTWNGEPMGPAVGFPPVHRRGFGGVPFTTQTFRAFIEGRWYSGSGAGLGMLWRGKVMRRQPPAPNPLTAGEVTDVLSRAAKDRRTVATAPPASAYHAYGMGRAHAYEHTATLYGPRGVAVNPRLPIDWQKDSAIRALFAWQTRAGIAPAAGSRPVGWYQIHHDRAYQALVDKLGGPGQVRVKRGMIEGRRDGERAWRVLGDVRTLYASADRAARGNPLSRRETAQVLRHAGRLRRAARTIRRGASRYQGIARASEISLAERTQGKASEAAFIAHTWGKARRAYLPNPRGGVRVVGSIPGNMGKIFYNRTGKYRGPYVHKFSRGVKAFRLSDGSVLLRGRKPLWVRQD